MITQYLGVREPRRSIGAVGKVARVREEAVYSLREVQSGDADPIVFVVQITDLEYLCRGAEDC